MNIFEMIEEAEMLFVAESAGKIPKTLYLGRYQVKCIVEYMDGQVTPIAMEDDGRLSISGMYVYKVNSDNYIKCSL